MSTLYDITNEYIEILNSCNDEEISSDEFAKKLENIDETFNEKAKNIALIIGELKAQCTAINEELDRLNYRLSTRYKNLKQLETYLKDRMLVIGKSKIETPIHTISIRKSVRTEIDDKFVDWAIENKKEDFINEKLTYTANRKLIKEQIEKGELNCPYVKLIENQNLIIR